MSLDPGLEPRVELGATVLRAVRGHHAFEGCVEQLATAIRLGVYPRGSALPPERELAERLGVSRATLREAIAALRAADFVNTTRGRGGGTVVSYRPAKPSARLARALLPRSDELHDMPGYELRCSVGSALYPDDAQDVDELVATADVCMRGAKATGKDRSLSTRDFALDSVAVPT